MIRFQRWLAVDPTATMVKVMVGAALGAVASWLATADVHPLIVAIGAAVIPVLVNWINDMDPRYGRGSHPYYADLASGQELHIEGED